jgi:pilus assembly protein Flp/PilA
MNKLITLLNNLKSDERGVTAIEYGIIGVAMAVLLGGLLATNGDMLAALSAAFENITTGLTNATSTTP